MNRIIVIFFATLRDRAGTKSVEIDIPDGGTVQDIKDLIARTYPNLAPTMESTLISINREYAFNDNVVPVDAEVAMFPPVSGG